MTYTLNTAGKTALMNFLTDHGRGSDNFSAWISEVDEALENRSDGESLEVELRGLRDTYGRPVFFEPSMEEVK